MDMLHLFFFIRQYLFGNVFFEERKFLLFTMDHNTLKNLKKESKVLYYGQEVFSLSQFHVMLLELNQFSPSHFLQCIVISPFHNNEHIVILGLAIKKLTPVAHIRLKNSPLR